MDQDAASRRARKVPPRPELYSTVVIHDDDEEDGEQQDRSSRPIAVALGADDDGGNDLGTMIVKTDRSRPRSQSTSTSSYSSARRGPAPPPPPPARLPRGSPFADARRGNPIKWADDEEEKEEEEDGEGFSTFVVRSGERESVSGTVVRRTGGGDLGSTSMRAVGDLGGFGSRGKGADRRRGKRLGSWPKCRPVRFPRGLPGKIRPLCMNCSTSLVSFL